MTPAARMAAHATVIIVAILALGPAAPARAATGVVEVGWWSSSPFSQAPEGGLIVGQSPSGTTGVSAIRFELGRGVTQATLVIAEDGGFGQDVAAIAVCRGSEDWTAVANGALEDAPEAQCGQNPKEMERDAGTWSVDLTPVVGDATGRVTVMLVPGQSPDPTGTLGLGWEVRLDPPTLQASEVAAPATTTTSSPAPSPGVTAPSAAPPASSRPVSGGTARPTATTVAPITTTTTLAVEAAAAEAPPTRPLVAPGGGTEGRPWGRFGGFILLSALVGGAAGGGRWLVTSGPLTRVRLPFLRR